MNGKEPGDTLQLVPNQPLRISAKVWSQLPVDRLEIIANGVMIAETAIAAGQEHGSLEIEFTPEVSTLIAARAYQFKVKDTRSGVSFTQRRDAGGGPTQLNRYFGTLRPETTFAHTSPAYLLLNDQPVSSREDADYFVRYLENAKHWLADYGSFPSPEAKKEVLEAFETGRRAFLDLANP